MKVTKKFTTEYVRMKLNTDFNWAIAGVQRILENQTEDEARCESTDDSNGIGFTGVDAKILTSIAKQYQKNKKISNGQLAVLYKCMPKYSKQIINASDKTKLDELVLNYMLSKNEK